MSGGYKSKAGGSGGALVDKATGVHRWHVALYPTSAHDKLTVYAYCASKGKKIYSYSNADPALPDHANTTVGEACKSGQKLVAGGYKLSQNSFENGSPTYADYDASGVWTVTSAFLNSKFEQLFAYGYCEQRVAVKVRSHSSGRIGPGGEGSATASCARGETLLSGGYETTPTPDWNSVFGPNLYYSASYRSGARSWTARAKNYSTVSGKIRVFVVCQG